MAKKVRLIDLSLPLENFPMEPQPTTIQYMSHRETAQSRARQYRISADDVPGGMHLASEIVTCTTHSATHLDAPYHYGPRNKTIDEVPLEWLYGDAVVLDFSRKKPGEWIAAQEVRDALARIGYTLKPMDIVLIRTDTWKHWAEWNFDELHPGMSREATLWLIDQGIKVMGIDAWGFDAPVPQMVEGLRQGATAQFFPSHYLGREREYMHAEKLAHLDQLPPFGFKVCLFPIKIKRASGAWIRAVAILEEP